MAGGQCAQGASLGHDVSSCRSRSERKLKVTPMRNTCPSLCLAWLASTTPAAAALPAQMQAAAIDQAGGAQMLTLHTLPVPRPAAGEVLIAVHTAGVASWDVEIRRKPDFISHVHLPRVLGPDGAGTLAALGAGVTDFRVAATRSTPTAGTIRRAASTPPSTSRCPRRASAACPRASP